MGEILPRLPYGKPAKEIVLETLREAEKPLTLKEILEKTNIKYNTVRGCLQRLRREGKVKKIGRTWTIT